MHSMTLADTNWIVDKRFRIRFGRQVFNVGATSAIACCQELPLPSRSNTCAQRFQKLKISSAFILWGLGVIVSGGLNCAPSASEHWRTTAVVAVSQWLLTAVVAVSGPACKRLGGKLKTKFRVNKSLFTCASRILNILMFGKP